MQEEIKGDAKKALKPVIVISVNGEGKVFVTAPMQNPRLCINLIADTLKILANYKPKIISSGNRVSGAFGKKGV